MKFLPTLIMTCMMASMAIEMASLYGEMVTVLFEQVSTGLIMA